MSVVWQAAQGRVSLTRRRFFAAQQHARPLPQLRRGPLAHLRPHSLIVLPRTKYPAGSRAGTPAWWVSTITELQSRCGTIDTEYPFYLDLLWLTPGAACSVSSSLALAFQSEELQHALLLLEARCVPCASCVVLLGSKLCCGKTFGVSRL